MGKSKKPERKGRGKGPQPKSSPGDKPLPPPSSTASKKLPRITLQDVLGVDKRTRREKERNGSDEDESRSSSSSSAMPPESEWDEQALALKEQIESGAFDHLLGPKKDLHASRRKPQKDQGGEEGDEESSSTSVEEVSLEDDDDNEVDGESESEGVKHDEMASGSDGDAESASEGSEGSNEKDREKSDDDLGDEISEGDEDASSTNVKENDVESPDDSDAEDEEGDPQDRRARLSKQNNINSKALHVVTASLRSQKLGWAWAETFDVVSRDPLPFDKKSAANETVDIHDDLKREVAFYDMALAAVAQARESCSVAKIPFSRPDDFFAEMIKTDDHMAKVKDRLIFETKKMEAVAQRKSNKEHKLRAREAQANRAAEKSKRKREHFTALDEWAQSAAAKRGRRTVDDDDEGRLRAFGQPRSASPGAPNKKRIAAERKFGFGGKRGRFKQNDRKTLNDTSTFNPRGSNFSGGTKITSKGKGSGGGGKGKRPGKRARDAKRSKR